jgi:ribosomal protein L27
LTGIRGKKSRGGGSTRNVAGTPGGHKFGLKVYDGQRVPEGTYLLSQPKPEHFPGWNVSFSTSL